MSALSINRSSFVANINKFGGGGALSIMDLTTIVVTATIFKNNKSPWYGTQLYYYGSRSSKLCLWKNYILVDHQDAKIMFKSIYFFSNKDYIIVYMVNCKFYIYESFKIKQCFI